jgi:hypothetical protein
MATDNRIGIKATDPELVARFLREEALGEHKPIPGEHYMDVYKKLETVDMKSRGSKPVLVQLPLLPAYAMTVHKGQSLSIMHVVHGCLEGIFAHDQMYVLASRVTDPQNFRLVGLPPMDLLQEVVDAWLVAGLDLEKCLRVMCAATDEWEMIDGPIHADIGDRLKHKWKLGQTIPMKVRTLAEILKPQPQLSDTLPNLLDWIGRADAAASGGDSKPAFQTTTGHNIFPPMGELWWLTDVQKRTSHKEASNNPAKGACETGEAGDPGHKGSSGEAEPQGGHTSDTDSIRNGDACDLNSYFDEKISLRRPSAARLGAVRKRNQVLANCQHLDPIRIGPSGP